MTAGRTGPLAPALAASSDQLEPHLLRSPNLHLCENDSIYKFTRVDGSNRDISPTDDSAPRPSTHSSASARPSRPSPPTTANASAPRASISAPCNMSFSSHFASASAENCHRRA